MQYRLTTLLVLVLVAGLGCAVYVVLPIWLGLLVLFLALLLLFAGLVSAVVYGRGGARAFALGALVGLSAWTLFAGLPVCYLTINEMETVYGELTEYPLDGLIETEAKYRFWYWFLGLPWPLAVFAGLTGMATRWCVTKRCESGGGPSATVGSSQTG